MACTKEILLAVLLAGCSGSLGFNLTIYDARQPGGYQNDERVLVRQGNTITFYCNATDMDSNPPIDFYKRRESGEEYVPNREPGSKMLQFVATRPNHNSILECYATMDFVKSIIVEVEGPPDAPTISSTQGAEAFTLECTSRNGFPASIVQWQESDTLVPNFTINRKKKTNNGRYLVTSTIQLKAAKELNQKTYRCVVNHTALLRPQIVEETTNILFCPDSVTLQCPETILNGTQYAFTCSTTEGNPNHPLIWYLQDEVQTAGVIDGMYSTTGAEFGGMSRIENYTTILTTVHNQQMLECRTKGQYSDLDCRPILRDKCVINVLFRPEINVQPMVEENEGESLSITCSVEANPVAPITWTKRDAPYPSLNYNTSTRISTLSVNPVTKEHAGIYNCQSRNNIGGMEKGVQVFIYYTPTEVPSLSPATVFKQSERITLKCEVEAQPLASIQWYDANGTILKETERLHIEEYSNKTDMFHPRTGSYLVIDEARRNVDDGPYRCEASNRLGTENIMFPVEIEGLRRRSSGASTAVPIVVILLLGCAAAAFFIVRRKRQRSRDSNINNNIPLGSPSSTEDSPMPNRVALEPPERQTAGSTSLIDKPRRLTPDLKPKARHVANDDLLYANVTASFDFPRNKLEILNELGQGAFGRVLRAKATGMGGVPGQQDVAVKTLKEGAPAQDKQDLLQEVELMKKLKPHPNVVRLLGCCIEKDPIYVIVEYMDKGNLKVFLRKDRSKDKDAIYSNLHGLSTSLTIIQLMKFADQVARGMEYLSSQKCIHRDLAARNVLINKDLICKVSDFGLARDVMDVRVYQRQRDEFRLPIRWMAVESISENTFSTESDVWAFGILLWEIITLGARPYPGTDTKDVVTGLKIGMRMPCPKHCPAEIYKIMESCWQTNPKDRPTFKRMCSMMQELLESESMHVAMEQPEESLYASTEISLANEKL